MAIPRPRLPRRTARLRLALLYGGMFLLGATAVIAMANLVAASNNPHDPPLPPALVSQIKHIERSALDQAAHQQMLEAASHQLPQIQDLDRSTARRLWREVEICGRILEPASKDTSRPWGAFRCRKPQSFLERQDQLPKRFHRQLVSRDCP